MFKLSTRINYIRGAVEQHQNRISSVLCKGLQDCWGSAMVVQGGFHHNHKKIDLSLAVSNSIKELKSIEGTLIRQYHTVMNSWNLRYEG